MLRRLIPAIVAGLALAACSVQQQPVDTEPVAAGSSKPAASSPAAVGKATITKCAVGDFDSIDVRGTLTNATAEKRDFNVRYELIDASGTRFDDGGTIVNALAPGQTVKWTGTTLGDKADRPAKFSCRMLSVESVSS